MKRGIGIIGFTVLLAGFAVVAVWGAYYPSPRYSVGDTVLGETGQLGTITARSRWLDHENGFARSWQYDIVYHTASGGLFNPAIPESWIAETTEAGRKALAAAADGQRADLAAISEAP